jgi:hypothetical protein
MKSGFCTAKPLRYSTAFEAKGEAAVTITFRSALETFSQFLMYRFLGDL